MVLSTSSNYTSGHLERVGWELGRQIGWEGEFSLYIFLYL